MVIISLLIVFLIHNAQLKKATIEIRDKVTIEINSKHPDKILYFKELHNIKENIIKVKYKNVDFNKAGEYPVIIKIYHKKFYSILKIVDTISPKLTTKDVKIKVGEKYKASDFVKSCTDNSGQKCKITFYKQDNDENGRLINFGNYTTEGKYNIKIMASDKSRNSTIKSATLIIGDKNQKPNKCKFGTSQYDKSKYVLGVDVTDKGCALDINLYNEPNIINKITTIMDQETEQLKNEFEKLNLYEPFKLNRHVEVILNNSSKGIVGYSIYFELLQNNVIIESFHLTTEGNRIYTVNQKNLP